MPSPGESLLGSDFCFFTFYIYCSSSRIVSLLICHQIYHPNRLKHQFFNHQNVRITNSMDFGFSFSHERTREGITMFINYYRSQILGRQGLVYYYKQVFGFKITFLYISCGVIYVIQTSDADTLRERSTSYGNGSQNSWGVLFKGLCLINNNTLYYRYLMCIELKVAKSTRKFFDTTKIPSFSLILGRREISYTLVVGIYTMIIVLTNLFRSLIVFLIN